jgi:hypothetical protein
MNYTDDIPESIGQLFKTTLPQYPPGAQIIIMSVNEQKSPSTSVPMTTEDSSVPMITEDSSAPMTIKEAVELELGSFLIPEIPQNNYFIENKENPNIDIFDLHEHDDKNHYYNNYDRDMLANLPEINPLAPRVFARSLHLPQEPSVSRLPVAPPTGGKKNSYKKKIKTKNYKKSNKSKKTRTMRRNQQKSRKVNKSRKANKSKKSNKSRKSRKARKSRKVRKYKV